MAKSEKIIQPINASMDDIACSVVATKPKKEDNSEDDKIINRGNKKVKSHPKEYWRNYCKIIGKLKCV